VVGADGSGQTSNLIQAVEWVIQNKERLNVRVANFSVSHPPFESYKDSPLAQSVGKLVESGVIAVASSGNLGKTSEYSEIYGAIGSPGFSPAVITVYPIHNQGTSPHQDDVAISYGSRGPTYIDHLMKPDLSAPGNQIPSALAAGSTIHRQHPDLSNGAYVS